MITEYTYLGTKLTDPLLKGAICRAVRRTDGKCIKGSNGSMLVEFDTGQQAIVVGRRLRKTIIHLTVAVTETGRDTNDN